MKSTILAQALDTLSSIIILFLLAGCTAGNHDGTIETLYFGGDILTMSGDDPEYVEAIVTSSDRLVFVGTLSDALERYPQAAKYDLQGATLLPGFIDGHAHFAGFPAQAVGAQILPPPDAGAANIDSLLAILTRWATPENVSLTGWIFGMGFDDSVLEERRIPTKDDLDKVSTDIPVMIIHISGHLAVVNSKGLEEMGITAESKDPEGGVIRRVAGTQEPNGVLEELAAIPYMPVVLAPRSEEAADVFLSAGQDMALSYGYTTAQEGRAMLNTHLFLEQAAKSEKLKIDVVSYIDYSVADSLMQSQWYTDGYTNHYRIGGMKLTLDGSPQGRTAWLTQPYRIPPEGAEDDYAGYPAIPSDSAVTSIYRKAFDNNWQILTHANGDAAIDQLIRTMREARSDATADRRDVLIHGQYIRADQLDSLAAMGGVIASLFPLHTYYWGDWHRELIGDSLGSIISPTRTALDKGLRLTIHTDAPVALPNLMRVIWTATSRTTRSNEVIGASERLTPYEALKGITDWSAYQHFEEEDKGTLEVGKLADLVIVSANPLKVEIEEIPNILVLQTIKEGVTVYSHSLN